MTGNDKKIIFCSGEEKFFDNELILFKLTNNDIELKNVKMYSSDNIINKILRNIGGKISTLSLDKFWKKNLSNYNTIILFDTVVKNSLIKYLRKKNPDIRIIIYFRNQFSKIKKKNLCIKKLKKLNCEFWSYNLNDCKKYGFLYNNQFWNENYLTKLKNKKNNKKIDCLFLGKIKDRFYEIKKLNKILNSFKLNCYFYLVPSTNEDFDMNKKNIYMDYLDYLKLLNNSNCVIDIVGKENEGLTLRPLEAMFLEKKLITNYKDIKKYDFYNKNNIFIYGEDDISMIKDFICLPYKKIDNKILKKYDFNNWIMNFFL